MNKVDEDEKIKWFRERIILQVDKNMEYELFVFKFIKIWLNLTSRARWSKFSKNFNAHKF